MNLIFNRKKEKEIYDVLPILLEDFILDIFFFYRDNYDEFKLLTNCVYLLLFYFILFILQINEWTTTGTFVTPQVRSLRKGNNDYVSIAVDEDPGSTSRIEDEEDDKGNFALLNLCADFWCSQTLWFLLLTFGFPTFSCSSWFQITHIIQNCP